MGRPTKLSPTIKATAATLAKLGLTDSAMARALGISRSTLALYKVADPSFSDLLRAGKAEADAAVVEGLHRRAVGFFDPTGEYHPPHVGAATVWLRARMPDQFRDVTRAEVSGPGGAPLTGPPTITLPPDQDAALQKLIQDAQERVRLPNFIPSIQ
jgi:transcriptional regulator with XRE-family HTH domain